MIRSTGTWLLLASFAVLALVLLAGVLHLREARADLSVASSRVAEFTQQAQALVRSRARSDPMAIGERPTQDVIASVHEALSSAQLPSRHLSDVKPERSRTSLRAGNQTSPLKQQRVSVTLIEMTTPDLGRFLKQWPDLAPAWTASRIELSHAPIRPGSGNPGIYTVRLTLVSTYLDTGSETDG